MQDRTLHARLLGIEDPWRVTDVTLRLDEEQAVVVAVAMDPDAALLCPKCESRGSRYDARERRWRHLDTMQYRTILVADVPRVQCDEHGVGTIVWLRAPFGVDGRTLRDINHPDPSRHETRVVGLSMLSGFRRESRGADIWKGGSVYDPGNGRTYQGTIRMDGADRLLLRGFIGISLLGRTTTWIRVGSEESPPQAPLAARVEDRTPSRPCPP